MKVDRIGQDHNEANHNFEHWPSEYAPARQQLSLLQVAYDTAVMFFHSNEERDVDDETFYAVVRSIHLNLQLERMRKWWEDHA